MQRIRIGRKAPIRQHRDRHDVLPLDPRDPAILRAKLLRRGRTTAGNASKPPDRTNRLKVNQTSGRVGLQWFGPEGDRRCDLSWSFETEACVTEVAKLHVREFGG